MSTRLEYVRELALRRIIPIAPTALAGLGTPSRLARPDVDRIEGMLLGLAIGDALGNTTEGLIPADRRRRFGEIRDYLPNPYAAGARVGLPSDDTQLAFWTLEHVLRHGAVIPEGLAEIFASRRIFGIGRTVRAFLAAYRTDGPWWEAAQPSAGNGALMRIAPVVVPHVQAPSPELWADAILGGAVTHNDPSSIAACVAFVGLLWELLGTSTPPSPTWWLDTYCARARPLEGEPSLVSRRSDLEYRGPIWRFVDTAVRQAVAAGCSVERACEGWYSGAFLLETVPSALHILATHADNPEAAIVRAVNDTHDNDTIAAVVGAAVGALHGRGGLPARWLAGLLGRTGASDDGRVFELVRDVRRRIESIR
jgi:ADP-ribosylglycohydrolase